MEEMIVSQLAVEWEASVQAFSTLLALAAGMAVLAITGSLLAESSRRTVRSRRFWCPSAGRDVETRFEEAGPPGFRQTLRVTECSAFEPASTILCRRSCRDATRRHPGGR